MADESGRHNADESATDRARVDYLAGETDVELDAADQAELDELRALLADPTLWSEPPAELEDSVVALIAAEAASGAPADAEVEHFPFVRSAAEPAPDQLADPASTAQPSAVRQTPTAAAPTGGPAP